MADVLSTLNFYDIELLLTFFSIVGENEYNEYGVIFNEEQNAKWTFMLTMKQQTL